MAKVTEGTGTDAAAEAEADAKAKADAEAAALAQAEADAKAKADMEAAALAQAEAAPPKAAPDDLRARIAQIEAGNTISGLNALIEALAKDGGRAIEDNNRYVTLRLDGVEAVGGPGISIALDSWCQMARIAIRQAEAA